MDKEKIERLKKQRLLLQKEERLKTLRKRISLQLDYLDHQKYNYKIYYENQHLDWIGKNIPLRKRDGYNGLYHYQIDVDAANPNDPSEYCDSDHLCIAKIREQFLTIQTKDSLLTVVVMLVILR